MNNLQIIFQRKEVEGLKYCPSDGRCYSRQECEECRNLFCDKCRGIPITRGSLVWINDLGTESGSVQHGGRPAVVVSNDVGNTFAPIISAVYLTTRKARKPLPTHCVIRSAPEKSMALCEQITTVSGASITDYLGECTPKEMEAINRCLRVALAL